MCGEKQRLYPNIRLSLGSPPRVRGKVDWCKARTVCAGITPACAGKSFSTFRSYKRLWDHPRVCGEKYFPIKKTDKSKGSPPRVRGKVSWLGLELQKYRITPACAGKSISFLTAPSPPRGSPPRVRGKDLEFFRDIKVVRITPACAGKSSRRL